MSNGELSDRRVLVVEDEYFIADELDQAFRAAGATVLGPVPSVEAALRLAENDIDGAVLDVNLGGEMVYPVADVLVARHVPFVFTTGYDQEALPNRHAGAVFLEKPVQPSRVVRVLAELFTRAGPPADDRPGA